MKKVIFPAIVLALISFTACNKSSNKSNETGTGQFACPMHSEVTGNQGDTCSKCGMDLTKPDATKDSVPKANTSTESVPQTTFTTTEIVTNYLALKNALTKDDSKAAASAGKALLDVFNNVDENAIKTEMKKTYSEIADDAKEHAEHIGDNAGKIDHQREHFVMLSKDITDLVKMFGSSQKLYQDFCPMYDNDKGAYWLSETKKIQNPYHGSEMLTCGSIKKEF